MINSVPPSGPSGNHQSASSQASQNAQAASGNDFGQSLNKAMNHVAAQVVSAASDAQKQQFKQKKIEEVEYTGYKEDEENEPEHLMVKRLKDRMRALVKLERMGLQMTHKPMKKESEPDADH